MKLKIVADVPFNTTPLPSISISEGEVIIEFDDKSEQRWRISFGPYQGVKVITEDCYDHTPFYDLDMPPFKMMEVEDSQWIAELKKELLDYTATFMDKAHHYILPFHDEVVEIVAWDEWVLEKIDS